MRTVCLIALLPVLACTAREPAATELETELFTVVHESDESNPWTERNDARRAVITEPGSPVTIPGRGRFVTAVAGRGEAECLLDGKRVGGGTGWIEIRSSQREGARLASRGGTCAWDSPRFVGTVSAMNVLMIVLDTMRADRLELSPALTDLAERSYRFEEAYANSSWTWPSHEAILSGRLPPARLGEVPSLAGLLARAGWRTSAVTAGFAVTTDTIGAGFEKFVVDSNAIEAADSWLARETGRGEPTFLLFHTYEIHDPYRHFEDARGGLGPTVTYSYGFEDPELEQQEDRARVRALYDGGVRFVDRRLRELFDAVAWEKTIVILTSDHGEPFWEHGYWRHGRGLYQEVLRIPLLIHVPPRLRRERGLSEPRDISTRAQLIDITPTILDLLGLELDPSMDGRSLLPQMSGDARETRAVIARGIFSAEFDKDAIIEGPYKLIRTRSIQNWATVHLELYDLRNDPEELVDLADSEPEIVAELLGRLESGRIDRPIDTAKPEVRKALESLGYLGDQ